MKKEIIIWLCTLILGNSLVATEAPNVRLTVHVITVDGQPVSGLEVGIGGGLSTTDGQYPRKANGLTDEKGDFTAIIACRDGIAGAFARGHGYYEAEVNTFRLYPVGLAGAKTENAVRTGRWEPWDQTVNVVILPIKNPVPAYTKRVVAFVPQNGKPCGYDLQKGDWVAPYGQGERTDVEFLMEGSVESGLNYDGKLTLQFPGAGNGIQAFERDQIVHSEFRLPYEAPEEGYGPSWSWRNARITENKLGATSTMIDESFLGGHFIFRVRSILDPQGRVIRANYGKIHAPVQLSPRLNGKWAVDFVYYFNPDETRNLEFDPKRNFFKDQNVIAP